MIGVPTGPQSGLWALDQDIDEANGVNGVETIAALGELPPTVTQSTPRSGRHALFRWDSRRPVRNSASKIAPGVDVRGDGGYIIVAGSTRSDGRAYQWLQSPDDVEIAEAPAWLYDAIEQAGQKGSGSYLASRHSPQPQEMDGTGSRIEEADDEDLEGVRWEQLRRVAEALPGTRNDVLNKAAYALGRLVGSGRLDRHATQEALIRAAADCGLVGDDGEQSVRATIKSGLDAGIRAHDRPPAYSDECTAIAFADRHKDNLRYVAVWGKWLHWTGTHWADDSTLQATDYARAACRAAASACTDPRIASRLASAQTVAAIERLARADRRVAASVDQWDRDPWLLNTPLGVVDLRTGEIRPHRFDDYITKVTAIGPDGDCPRFVKFLQEITGGDPELQAYLCRVFGYALTGLTSEHALFFAHGSGANGKSVLLSTVAGVLGTYHTTAPVETFTVSTGDKHPTEIAMLQGARLVTAVETEEGRRWAESRIKQLTGGDEVSARFMRQDFFKFVPAFKLMIAGNHKPSLRSVDESISRRFHMIPFAVTIPLDDRDPALADKLKTEWPGILAWMIRGCLDWQRRGLARPQAVAEATDAYLESEDTFSAWINECCERDPEAWETASELFASWCTWAKAAGESPGTSRSFAKQIEQRGAKMRRHAAARGYSGFRLRLANGGSQSGAGRGVEDLF